MGVFAMRSPAWVIAAILVTGALVCSAASAGGQAAPRELVLVKDGVSRCEVVTPESVSEPLAQAVADLQLAFKLASGAEVDVSKTAASGADRAPIRVSVFARTYGESGVPLDGYVIAVTETGVSISGPTEEGAANGVYRFIDRQLGVIWPTPGAVAAEGPRPTVSVPVQRLVGSPACTRREILGLSAAEEMRWARRNGFGPSPDILGRSFESLVVSKLAARGRLAQETLAKAGRPGTDDVVPGLCLTNHEVIAAAAQVAVESLKQNPQSDTFYLWITWPGCRCDECSKLDAGQGQRGGRHSFSGSYLHFVTKVAARVALEVPRKKIGYVAAGNFALPPRGATLPPNVVALVPLDSREQGKGSIEQDRELLSRWRSVTSKLIVLCDDPWAAQSVESLVVARRAGALGWIGRLKPTALSAPRAHVISRMLWEDDAKADKLLERYLAIAYGAAASEMKAFHQASQDAYDRKMASQPYHYSPDVNAFEKAWSALAAAKQASFGPPRERIEAVEKEFSLSYLPARAYELATSAATRDLRSVADLASVVADLQAALGAATAGGKALQGSETRSDEEAVGWLVTICELLRRSVERIRAWSTENLTEDEREIALTDLSYRLTNDPWAERAMLREALEGKGH